MTAQRSGVLLWLRRDLRLADHPALTAALQRGEPIWPVFILDDTLRAETGAASRWRLERSLAALGTAIAERGGRLIVREGDATETLRALAAETGAAAVYWSRAYTPLAMAQMTAVKAALREQGLEAESFSGSSLAEPWEVQTKTGGAYRVYTPFWRALRAHYQAPDALPAPDQWPASEIAPESETLDGLGLGAEMRRGAEIVARFSKAGEDEAERRLSSFLTHRLKNYADDRNALGLEGGSGLSPHLAMGEIAPHRIWRATRVAMLADPECEKGGWTFLSEIAWRDFAWHLGYHTPELFNQNWRAEWDAFPWRGDSRLAELWRRGRTGEPIIDAAMRELYVTGVMHNRARMLVASYLTKHLLTDWRIGAQWFRDTLIDYDPASNAMGWQWSAGSGPDAAPFFRIFNPATQAQKFDPSGAYLARWAPEAAPNALALASSSSDGRLFFDGCPRSWGLSPDDPYPSAPLVDLAEGRQRALAAYDSLKRAG